MKYTKMMKIDSLLEHHPDVAALLAESMRLFRSEDIPAGRKALDQLAQYPDCAMDALDCLRANDVPATLREDYIVAVGKHDPSLLGPMLQADPEVAELAVDHQELHFMTGGVEALAQAVNSRTGEARHTLTAKLVKWAVIRVLDHSPNAPFHMLEVVGSTFNLGQVSLRAMRVEHPSVLHYFVEQIKRDTRADYEDVERAVFIMLKHGVDLEAERPTKGMFLQGGAKTPLQYACYVRDDMDRVGTESDTLDHLINVLLAAGAQWAGCNEGSSYSSQLVRNHPTVRKQALLEQVPDLQPDIATRKHKL